MRSDEKAMVLRGIDGKRLDASYWWRNVRDSVIFSSAITKMVDRGDRIFLELGPHPILCGAINECAASVGEKSTAIGRQG